MVQFVHSQDTRVRQYLHLVEAQNEARVKYSRRYAHGTYQSAIQLKTTLSIRS